ncbi:MAG: peptidyl-prolyl cis-trans isomerase [Bryobacteraceae bacterium]|nr:peptidyl-prolyl cis-trans isomerase [Bryobacteraceae bacterium]
MFHLFRRKDTVLRYVLMFFLGLIAVSMVWSLTPLGSGGSGIDRSETTIAEIDGQPVTLQEAANRVEQQLRNQNVPRSMGYILANNIVDGLIAQRAVEYEAKRMGYGVNDAEVTEAIKNIIPQLFVGGQFAGTKAYQDFLAQRGMSVADFESQLRKSLLISKVQGMIAESVVVTPADIEAEFRRNNEKIALEYIVLKTADVRKDVTVTDAEVAAEFEKRKATLKQPEKRSAAILVIDRARVAAAMEPSEADLRRAYEDSKDRFRTGERVNVRHILVKTTEKPAAEVAKLEAKAQDLLKQIKAGADFAKLARENSEDPGSAVKGGDLGFIVKGQTVPNFEAAAWALKTPKELSNVVKTEYGFHILQLISREDARLRPFEEVRGELAADFSKQAVFEKMQRDADALRAAAAKTPDKLEAVAQQFNAALVRTPAVLQSASQFGEPVGASPELAAQIFSIKLNEATQVVELANSRLGVAVVTGVEPERSSKLEEVAATLREEIAQRKATDLLQSRGKTLAERAKAPGADFKKLAAEFGGQVKNAPAFARTGAIEGIGPTSLVKDAFGKPVGTVTGPHPLGDATYVVKVTEVQPADLLKLAMEREKIVGELRQRRAREREELFSQGLVDRLTKAGKIKVNQDTMKRLLSSFGAA